MTSCQGPIECGPSRYRHGNDPPKHVEADPFSERKLASPSTQSLILLIQLHPSFLTSVFRLHPKSKVEPTFNDGGCTRCLNIFCSLQSARLFSSHHRPLPSAFRVRHR